ncbi:MAG TPA: glycosyltransferase family 4 protein [Micromonosporaceae bacterium]|nr:glycosyltransferase family 4 protein [Micromonosporaceae bacterium]
MKIALVLASSTGGIGSHVASLVTGLAADDEVTVCGPAATQEQFRFTERGATRFYPVEIRPKPRPWDARVIGVLRRVLAEVRPDVVHAHGMRAGFVAVAARSGVPLVVTWHNAALAGGLGGPVNRIVERWVARSADVTLGAYADLVERAVAFGARDARLCEVAAPELPPPARTRAEVREELGLAKGRPLILSVGRLHQQKGFDVLVDAATRWRNLDPVPLVAIAGKGPEYLDLTAQISHNRAPVLLLGHRTDVADLLGAADLAVVSSNAEARQLFAQEALRAAVPLVATAVGGIPELVGDAALLVPAGDAAALDSAVWRMLSDPALRRQYAERGPLQAKTWPTERDTVDAVRAVYAELAGSR